MPPYRTVLLLAAVFFIASFMRFFALDTTPPGLYPDEAMNGNDGRAAFEERDFKVFYPNNNGREGLFINIVGVSVRYVGNTPLAVRLPSALFGTLTVLGLFFLARELFRTSRHKERIALFASFFLATSFWHVNFSRIGFRAIMAPFFLVWGLYFAFRIIRDAEQRRTLAPVISAVAGGLLFGLGMHSYIAYRVSPILLAFPFFSGIRNQLVRRGAQCIPCFFALFIFFSLVAASPLLFYFTQNPGDFFGRTSQISIFAESSPLRALGNNVLQTLGMFWFRGDGNWRHNIAGSPQLVLPVGILFAIGIFIALQKIFFYRKKNAGHGERYTYGFLLSWVAILLLPVVTSNEGIPHALRAIGVIPAVAILAAIGLNAMIWRAEKWFAEKQRQYPAHLQLRRIKYEMIVLLFVLLVGIGAWDANNYFLRWAGNPRVAESFDSRSVDIGNLLNGLPSDSKKYVIVNASGVKVNGIPMPAQTIMFVSNTASTEEQRKKSVTYLLPEEIDRISDDALVARHIITLHNDPQLREKIKARFPSLHFQSSAAVEFLTSAESFGQ